MFVTESSERSAIVDALRENATQVQHSRRTSEYSQFRIPRFAASDDDAPWPRQGRNDRGNNRNRRDGRRR